MPTRNPAVTSPYNRPVAELHDWVELGKDTISSLKTKDVTDLYALEWPETRKMLIADYQSKIDNDPRRLRRVVRTQSALLLGLARRLAPHRRLFFLIAFVGFFISLGSLLSDHRLHHAGHVLAISTGGGRSRRVWNSHRPSRFAIRAVNSLVSGGPPGPRISAPPSTSAISGVTKRMVLTMIRTLSPLWLSR